MTYRNKGWIKDIDRYLTLSFCHLSLLSDAKVAKPGSYCDVFIQKGNYFTSVGTHAKGISIPSRTYVHNAACIMALPTDLAKYDIISMSNVSEATFDGGAKSQFFRPMTKGLILRSARLLLSSSLPSSR